jgi:hypothetical protein
VAKKPCVFGANPGVRRTPVERTGSRAGPAGPGQRRGGGCFRLDRWGNDHRAGVEATAGDRALRYRAGLTGSMLR